MNKAMPASLHIFFSAYKNGDLEGWKCYRQCWKYMDSGKATLKQICRIGASYDIPENVIRMHRKDWVSFTKSPYWRIK